MPGRDPGAKDALKKLWSRYAKDEAQNGKTSSNGATPQSDERIAGDEELLDKARNAGNGVKFRNLYDRGDISGYVGKDGLPDDSAADDALCCLLAFWTGKEAGRMDRLFRRSRLMRDKWDEKHYADGRTYGEGTIDAALDLVTTFYDPHHTAPTQEPSENGAKPKTEPEPKSADRQPRDVAQEEIVPELPEKARIDEDLAAGASPWLEGFIAWSQRWSPRSYVDFHEMVGVWVLSTVAARRVVLSFGRDRYPSLYLGLVARSSLYPKTTATDNGRSVLRQSDLDWLLAPDESTPQRFIYDLVGRLPNNFDDLPAAARDRILKKLALPAQRGWSYEEFGQHLSAMMREGSFMADWRGMLRRFDDSPDSYEYATITRGSDYVEKPYLALLVTFTPADLKPLAGKGAGLWSDGFLARFAFSTPSRIEAPRWERFPEGRRRLPDELLQPIVNWHNWLGVPEAEVEDVTDEEGKSKGKRILRDPIAPRPCFLGAGVVDRFYAYHDGLLEVVHKSQQTDLDASYARLAEKALRVAMLLAALENRGKIELRHWARAQQVTEHWRRSLHYLYEQISEGSPDEDAEVEEKILGVVRKLGGATPNDIVRWVRNVSRSAAKQRLDGLAHAGLLSTQTTRKGTPRYVPIGEEP